MRSLLLTIVILSSCSLSSHDFPRHVEAGGGVYTCGSGHRGALGLRQYEDERQEMAETLESLHKRVEKTTRYMARQIDEGLAAEEGLEGAQLLREQATRMAVAAECQHEIEYLNNEIWELQRKLDLGGIPSLECIIPLRGVGVFKVVSLLDTDCFFAIAENQVHVGGHSGNPFADDRS